MSLEREAKFSTWPGFELPDLDRVLPSVNAGARSEARLDATYWDTPDLRLIRWGITVRHRAQGGHGEWTVKLPGTVEDGVLSRPEYNFDGPPAEIPFEVRDLVRAYARTTPLEPVARLQTVRRSLPLFDPRGHRIAEVADDEVSVLDGDRVAARFREVELEVVETAPPTLLPALIERVRAAGAGHPDPTPKLVRALGPRALAAPELSGQGLDETANVGEVLRAAMTSAVLRILHHDAIVRLDSGPEGVHQARVGTRRLRSDLRTFAPILDEAWVEALREELSWLAEALGRVRDADVLLARLERASKELAAQDQRLAESVRMRLRRQRAVHRRALLEVLRSDAYVVLLDRLVDAARSPKLSEAAGQAAKDALPALVRRPWKKLTKAVDELEADGAIEHRHEVRIRGKRVRYAADAASLAMKDAVPMAKELAGMQDVLGEEHDAVVAEEWLRGIAVTNVSRAEALVIGMLIAVEQREAREWEGKWPDAWAAVSKRKVRQWLS